LKPDGKPSPEDGEVHGGLVAEYYVLRTALVNSSELVDIITSNLSS
jgi:hypothetical protein